MVCRVCGLVLRGVCLMRPCEIDWMYRGGCGALYPKAWEDFVGHLTLQERSDPLTAYYARLTSDDSAVREAAVRALTMSLRCRMRQTFMRTCPAA